MIKVNCANCGEEKEVCPYIAKRNKNNFCDYKCRGAWQTISVKVNCANCGQELQRHPYRKKNTKHHFCDNKCRGAWQTIKVKVNCENCGEEKEVVPSKAKIIKKHFCDNKCWGVWVSENQSGENHPGWRGGSKGYRGPNWQEQRKLALIRAGFKCQVTGQSLKKLKKKGLNLAVHHIERFSSFGYILGKNDNCIQANDLNNLIVVASNIHLTLEAGKMAFQPHMM